jgi:hypothetical protein
MERLTLSFTARQVGWLKHEAQRLGITIGDLLRRIIDEIRQA